MLYFDKNEGFYLNVQNKISDDGTPFKQLFTEQNIFKKKKTKSRQTFGGNDTVFKKIILLQILIELAEFLN